VTGQYRFPRAERLTRKSEYATVFKHGVKWVGRDFVCYMVRCEGQGSKLGLAVSRKVGNAVARNRVKRYLREFYRTHRAAFCIDAHLVVVARPSSGELGYEECAAAMAGLLRQGGMLGG